METLVTLLKWPSLNNQFPLNLFLGDFRVSIERDYGFYLENMCSLNTTCGYPTCLGFDR